MQVLPYDLLTRCRYDRNKIKRKDNVCRPEVFPPRRRTPSSLVGHSYNIESMSSSGKVDLSEALGLLLTISPPGVGGEQEEP